MCADTNGDTDPDVAQSMITGLWHYAKYNTYVLLHLDYFSNLNYKLISEAS